MAFRLTPRDTSFYDLFNRSADNNVKGAELLAQMISAPQAEREGLSRQIRDLEHDSDTITHEVLNKLAATFITPFDREDIYRLAGELDDVMDFIEASADLIVLYQLDELPAETVAAADVLVRSCVKIAEGVPMLRQLKKGILDVFVEVNRLENEGDKLYRKTVVRLFSGEYDALSVLKLKEVVDQLEAAIDACENLADAVETIVVKES